MSTAESPRTLVVGLESAALDLIEKWVDEGSLPFLGSMLRTCPLVTLRTPIHVLQPCVWPSLLTGASPGRHGRYQIWSQIQTGTYDFSQPPAMLGSLRALRCSGRKTTSLCFPSRVWDRTTVLIT